MLAGVWMRCTASPSQALLRQLPQRGSLWRNQKLCRTAKASPFGRGGEERSDETERASQ